MKTICFYVSNHGFGHASRSIALIQQVLSQNDKLMVIVKTTGPQLDFMHKSLKEFGDQVVFRDRFNDVGIILHDGDINVDSKRLYQELEQWTDQWDNYVREEVMECKKDQVSLIVSDITPQAFLVAKELGIPGVGISNFTWHWVYKGFFGDGALILDKFRNAYQTATKMYWYAINSHEYYLFRENQEVGLICREINQQRVLEIRQQFKGKKIVLVSLGRSVLFDRPLKSISKDHIFLTTEGVEVDAPHTYRIGAGTLDTQNYIAASDVVITKAGWSTVAEAVIANRSMLLLRRQAFKEDMTTIGILEGLGIGTGIPETELLLLDKLLNNWEANLSKDVERNYMKLERLTAQDRDFVFKLLRELA